MSLNASNGVQCSIHRSGVSRDRFLYPQHRSDLQRRRKSKIPRLRCSRHSIAIDVHHVYEVEKLQERMVWKPPHLNLLPKLFRMCSLLPLRHWTAYSTLPQEPAASKPLCHRLEI